jgi:hypothetical protein
LIILSGFAPLPAPLQRLMDTAVPITTLPQPATDLDQPLTVSQVNGRTWLADHPPAHLLPQPIPFGETAALIGYDVEGTAVVPGATLSLITYWQLGPPAADIRLFTHLTGADGTPIAQADLLAAPSETWVSGDLLLQLHQLPLPADMPPGFYSLRVGWYTCLDTTCEQSQRLLTPNQQEYVTLQEITITP